MTTLKSGDKAAATTLVVGISSKKDSKGVATLVVETSGSKALSKLNEKQLLDALKKIGATGSADEVKKLPIGAGTTYTMIVTSGLGATQKRYEHEKLRRAAGAASRELGDIVSADFSLPHDDLATLAAIAEGVGLGAYNFIDFRGTSKAGQKKPLKDATLLTSLPVNAESKAALKRAEIISKNVHLTRDFINTPPSHLTPVTFSERMKKIASGLGLKVEILNESQLKAKGYGGITAVGQGSANPPRLLHISYSPARPKKRFAFVGKGITFDSGGLALKPAAGMEAMKSDMSGAAAVVAALFAIAELKLPVAVDAWAPLAENMVSDTATRPSDIITMYGGKTVEVLNPDAEGRLVLADAIVRATEVGKKAGGLDGLVNVATLTGAQVVALGTRTSAVMTNNEEFRKDLLAAADSSGELFWPMPLPEELRPSFDSPVADIANIGDRMGGMLVAGLFLKEFVEPEIPWCHLDIAGPAFNERAAHGYTPVGGTGVSVRTLLTLVEEAL